MKKKFLTLLIVVGFLRTAAPAAEPLPLAPYPSCEELLAQVRGIAESHPDRVRLEELGKSVAGRPILALRFHLGAETKPEALITGGIHAQEFIGTEVALAAARRLAEGQADPLLQKSDLWVVPALNIDGHCQVYENRGKGNSMTKGRKNLHGVDLNRNFPEAPGAKSRHPLAGNRRPRSSYYMGTQALSEPETQALAELSSCHRFYAAINLHSVSGKYLYPYCYTKATAPQSGEFIRIGQALVRNQAHPYKVQQSYTWYPTLGDLDDFLYIQHGALSATVEVGTIKSNLPHALRTFNSFWIANPKDVTFWTDNDAGAVLAGILQAFELTGGQPVAPPGKPAKAESRAIIYPTVSVP